jgi:hypothetical protein
MIRITQRNDLHLHHTLLAPSHPYGTKSTSEFCKNKVKRDLIWSTSSYCVQRDMLILVQAPGIEGDYLEPTSSSLKGNQS